MTGIASVGLDIAKEVFQVYGAGKIGNEVVNRRFRRAEIASFFEKLPPCIVGIEACNSGHYWARTISAFGHDVRLIHPHYVKQFVKRGKTDAIDAEAINEAALRRGMRFVPVKTAEQQATTMIFRARNLMVRQRIQAANALRSHLAELGIVTRTGLANLKVVSHAVRHDDFGVLPDAAKSSLELIVQQIEQLSEQVRQLDRQILTLANRDSDMQRLMTIPGIGPITAAAIKTSVVDIKDFKSARHFAAWLGLTPKVYSSGGHTVLGRISKMGDRTLRSLLVSGATSALRVAKADERTGQWLLRLRERRPFKVAAVALANKMARVVWALLAKGGTYRTLPLALADNGR